MNVLLAIALALVRGWTRLYTSGLPAALRTNRRAEIACDLWEHQHLAKLERTPASQTALEVLLRLLLGVPSDVGWRLEHGKLARAERSSQMRQTWTMRGALLAGTVATLWVIGTGVYVVAGGGSGWDSGAERVGWGLLVVLAGAAMTAGLLLSGHTPRLGLTLLAVGVLGISILWYWALVITIPVGVVLLGIAYVRSRARSPLPAPAADAPSAPAGG